MGVEGILINVYLYVLTRQTRKMTKKDVRFDAQTYTDIGSTIEF